MTHAKNYSLILFLLLSFATNIGYACTDGYFPTPEGCVSEDDLKQERLANEIVQRLTPATTLTVTLLNGHTIGISVGNHLFKYQLKIENDSINGIAPVN